jgi:hypothetical protein
MNYIRNKFLNKIRYNIICKALKVDSLENMLVEIKRYIFPHRLLVLDSIYKIFVEKGLRGTTIKQDWKYMVDMVRLGTPK